MRRSRFLMLAAGLLLGGSLLLSPSASGSPVSPAGHGWSVLTPRVPGAPVTSLAAVTCVAAGDCWAVGDRFKSASSNAGPALIEHYMNGRWSAVAAPAAQEGTLDELSAVACLSATDCWAVGMRSGLHPGTLFEHYGARGRWSVVQGPEPQGQLSSLSCVPAEGQCWAIGSSNDFHRVVSFHLVAGHWHHVNPAALSSSFVQANAVACTSSESCLLVGFFTTPGHSAGQALAERWNGQSWSRIGVPGVLAGGGSLAGVGCAPASADASCWVVGQTGARGSGLVPIHPLVERWNGTSLVLAPSPAGGPGDYPELKAVACASSGACQAVGSRGSGEDEASVLTEGWNGARWADEESPSPLYGFQSLSGVACPAPRDCWAVGEGLTHSFSGSRMIIEHFS